MSKFKLTKTNYYSPEANQTYMSASFVKSMLRCEAATMAELTGEWVPPPSDALLVGSYVDSYFEGPKSFERFIAETPEIINSRTGELKAPFRRADEMIERAKSDPVFMQYMKGQKQKIVTGEIMGIPFKCKFDVYRKGERIVDLKTTKDFQPRYVEGQGRISFADAFGYPLQMAIYQYLEGNHLPCYLAVVTKEDPPDIAVIQIDQARLDSEMEFLRAKLPRLDAIKRGLIEPERCGKCAYCRATKKITSPIPISELEVNMIG